MMDKKQFAPSGALDASRLTTLHRDYLKDEKHSILRKALSRHSLTSIVYDQTPIGKMNMLFSLDLKTMPAMNQKASGRCWIYAGLNLVREIVAKQIGAKKLELSTNYLALYDKIEKTNYALENCLYYADRDKDDRELKWFLENPLGDGGQWDMLVNLIDKYGLMPMDQFPDSYHAGNTRETDYLVQTYIRNFASKAWHLVHEGKVEEARKAKEETMDKLYKLFLSSFGLPPEKFDFEYETDRGYKVVHDMTPLEFKEKYVGDALHDFVSLINSPTEDKPYVKSYTVDRLGNVIEGNPVRHLNVTMDRMKELILKQLKDGVPVWFGSDVGAYRDRNVHFWDDGSLAYEEAFGLPLDIAKADMLDFNGSAMGHAMLIVGVNLVENEITKWKIENSWGTDNGIQGYYAMSPSWFDKFVYQAVVHKKFLSSEELRAYLEDPVVLRPWDPMGTLAD